MEMPKDWREKERRLLREERIKEMRKKIGKVFPDRSEEFRNARLKEQTEKIDKDPLINDDIWMADFMKKKYGTAFLTYVTGELPDLRKVEKQRVKPQEPGKPILPSGWMCTFCDPEPEFASSQQLAKHIEVFHPEIKTLNYTYV